MFGFNPKPTPERAVWRGWTAQALRQFLDRRAESERTARVKTFWITSIELHPLQVGEGADRDEIRQIELTGYIGGWSGQRIPVAGNIGIGSRENDCGWIFLGALEKEKTKGDSELEPQLNFYLAVKNEAQLARIEELVLLALSTRTAEVWLNVRIDYTRNSTPPFKEFLLGNEQPESIEYFVEWFHMGVKAGRDALDRD